MWGKLSGGQVKVERSLNYQHPKVGGPRVGVGHPFLGGKNHDAGGLKQAPWRPQSLFHIRGQLAAWDTCPLPITCSYVTAWLWREFILPHCFLQRTTHSHLPDLVLTPKVHFLLLPSCFSPSLPPSDFLSYRFLGDMSSPVHSSEPQQGQVLKGSLQTGPEDPPPPAPYSKMGLYSSASLI